MQVCAAVLLVRHQYLLDGTLLLRAQCSNLLLQLRPKDLQLQRMQVLLIIMLSARNLHRHRFS